MRQQFELNLKVLKKTNKLLNRMHKKMPYDDNYQPIYFASILRLTKFWLTMTKVNDMNLIIELNKTPHMVVPPLKNNGDLPDREDILLCLEYIKHRISTTDCIGRIVKIESFPTKQIENYTLPDYVLRKNQSIDYVFDINEQNELKGSKFRKVRNVINKFKRDNTFYIEDMKNVNTSKYVDEMMQISTDTIKYPSREYSLRELINKYGKVSKVITNLDGFIIFDNKDKIMGYEIHHKVKHTPTMFGVIKRTRHEYKGLSHYVEQYTAQRMLEKYPSLKYINNASNTRRELGDFKRSMRPIRFEYSSILRLKDKVVK